MHALFGIVVAIVVWILAAPAAAGTPLAGLRDDVRVRIDQDRVPHIEAKNEHDLFFMQGWMHARDRLFQMDVSRRQASGTLAELLGPGAISSDVQLRTIGLRRAAARSLPILSPDSQAVLEAYAAGVNAYVNAHPLPPEYTAVGVGGFVQWTSIDSLAVGKLLAFSLSFDLDTGPTINLQTYIQVGQLAGFNGQTLYFQDLFRSAPFDPAASVPDALARHKSRGHENGERRDGHDRAPGNWDRETHEQIEEYLERARQVPLLKKILERDRGEVGSNIWAVSGRLTKSGEPLLANDPHLGLTTPAIFYINHLRAEDADIDVHGHTFPGTPGVVLGQNRWIAWGATVTGMDVTDTYQESVVPCATSLAGLCTVYLGNNEPIVPISEVFRYNNFAGGLATATPGSTVSGAFIPPATLIVPRRNDGPIISLNTTTGVAFSVQYTGFSGTAELQAILGFNKARDIHDFRDALQDFDFGSQNWMIIDRRGNIAYYTSAEIPLREDLQDGTVAGPGPAFVRNGTGGNEWIRDDARSMGQAIPFKVLPFNEMPQIVNPPADYVINANNDPAGVTRDNNPFNTLRKGGGIFYIGSTFDAGFRAGRITDLLPAKLAGGDATIEDMKKIQADVVMLDAQVFTPHILRAFKNAKATGAHAALAVFKNDQGIAEAIGRLKHWNQSTPTGIPQGYDASDVNGQLSPSPSQSEIANSVAATIYSVWRGRFVNNTIDAVLAAFAGSGLPDGLPPPGNQQVISALRNLIEKTPFTGVGASGLNFFPVPGVGDAATRRDILLLKSLADALDALKSDAYKAAFDNSTNQEDYRWGKLHRLTLPHLLGGAFSIPPAGGFGNLESDLPGLAVDGGFGVVDASNHSVRGNGSGGFTFGSGPARRFVATVGKDDRIASETSLPGGQSGVISFTNGNPHYANLLGRWLTNETIPSRMRNFKDNVVEILSFNPLATAQHNDHDRDDD